MLLCSISSSTKGIQFVCVVHYHICITILLCMCGIEIKAVLHHSRLRLHGNVSRKEETNWLKRCMGNGVKLKVGRRQLNRI